jgi:hypothetical protein
MSDAGEYKALDGDEILEIVEGATDRLDCRLWEAGSTIRIYLQRALSRGRRQEVGYVEVGYVEVEEEMEMVVVGQKVGYSASRIRSHVRDLSEAVEAAIAARGGVAE